jgi:hypothetical protein
MWVNCYSCYYCNLLFILFYFVVWSWVVGEPITVAARDLRHELSSPARTLGSWGGNPTRGMDARVRLLCVSVVPYVGRALESA